MAASDQMVFIAADSAAQALQAGVGHAPTPALREAFDVTDPEEAEYAALVLASITALATLGRRFVIAAEMTPDQLDDSADTGNGEVTIRGLRRSQIVSWFTDEEPDHAEVKAAAAAASGLSTDDAWELPAVQTLITRHALLWHAAEELEN